MISLRANRYFTCLLFLLAVTASALVHAQSTHSSPYSRYGIGDIQYPGINQTLGMGGTGIGLYSNLSLNFSNPASYARLQFTTCEAGLNANFVEYRNKVQSQRDNSMSVGYFALAFPLKSRKSAVGFGVVPLSNVGYYIDDLQTNTLGNPELHVYEGSGGLNQLFVTAAATPFKNLTAGIHLSTLFGELVHERRVEIFDATFLNTRYTDARSQKGLYFTFGLQYTLDSLRLSPADSLKEFRRKIVVIEDSLGILSTISRKPDNTLDTAGFSVARESLKDQARKLEAASKKVAVRRQRGNWNLTAGFTLSPMSSLSASRNLVGETFRYVDNFAKDQVIIKDTIAYTENEKGDVNLPLSVGFGLTLRKGNQWTIGTDIRTQNWSSFSTYGESDSLANSWRWSAGAQFVPDERGFNSYWKQMQYMAGFHYSQSFLQLQGTQLTEVGVSIGAGFPIRRGLTSIRFMAEAGKRGTVDSGLLEERFIRFTMNFSLNDRWFIKQRYD